MMKMVCELCGSDDFIKENDLFKCNNCGLKYTIEDAKKLMQVVDDEPSQSSNDSNADDNCEDENINPDKVEKTLMEVFLKEITENENLEEKSNEELIQLASDLIVGFVNEINKADNEAVHTTIDVNTFLRAESYLMTVLMRVKNNMTWEFCYLFGTLEMVQEYDNIVNGFDTDPFNWFSRSLSLADEETIKNRILPFIDNLKKHYIGRYEAGLIPDIDMESYKDVLIEYLHLYNLYADSEDKYVEDTVKALTKDKEDVINKMNAYKERYMSISMEIKDYILEIGSIKKQGQSHLLGIKANEKEQINNIRKNKEQLEEEQKRIIDEAYELAKQHLPNVEDEEYWKKRFKGQLFKYSEWIYTETHLKQSQDKEYINELYDNLEKSLEGYGFAPEDYISYGSGLNYFGSSSDYDFGIGSDYGYSSSSSVSNASPYFTALNGASYAKEVYIYEKNHTYGTPLYTVKEGKVYPRNSTYGSPLFTIEGNKIYEKTRTYGTPLFTVQEDKVYENSRTYGTPAFTIVDDKIYEKNHTYGMPMFTVEIK